MVRHTRDLKVLLAADSLQESETIRSTLKNHVPRGTKVEILASVAAVRERLASDTGWYDAALVAWDLDDGQGYQLFPPLRAACKNNGRTAPSLFLVTGHGQGSPEEVTGVLRQHPDVVLIEKPYFVEDVCSTVVEAILPRSLDSDGYYGLRLVDLIQAYTLPRRSATLRIFTPDGRIGVVALREGHLVHATIGAEQGLEALGELMATRRGRIRLDRGCTTALRTIKIPTEQALIHIARYIDEVERDSLIEDTPPDIEGENGRKTGY